MHYTSFVIFLFGAELDGNNQKGTTLPSDMFLLHSAREPVRSYNG